MLSPARGRDVRETRINSLIDERGYLIAGFTDEQIARSVAMTYSRNTENPIIVILGDARCLWTERDDAGIWTIKGD